MNWPNKYTVALNENERKNTQFRCWTPDKCWKNRYANHRLSAHYDTWQSIQLWLREVDCAFFLFTHRPINFFYCFCLEIWIVLQSYTAGFCSCLLHLWIAIFISRFSLIRMHLNGQNWSAIKYSSHVQRHERDHCFCRRFSRVFCVRCIGLEKEWKRVQHSVIDCFISIRFVNPPEWKKLRLSWLIVVLWMLYAFHKSSSQIWYPFVFTLMQRHSSIASIIISIPIPTKQCWISN